MGFLRVMGRVGYQGPHSGRLSLTAQDTVREIHRPVSLEVELLLRQLRSRLAAVLRLSCTSAVLVPQPIRLKESTPAEKLAFLQAGRAFLSFLKVNPESGNC
jgi:hypothetical protein